MENLKKKIENKLIEKKDKLLNKNLKVGKHPILKAIGLYGGCEIIKNLFPTVGFFASIGAFIYYFNNVCLPFIRKQELKFIDKALKNRKNKVEPEKEKSDTYVKSFTNKIKNLYVTSKDKFIRTFKVAKDTNGKQMISGSYRLSSYEMVDNRLELPKNRTAEQKDKIKTYKRK